MARPVIPTPDGDTLHPTQVQYLDWFQPPGQLRCWWNWDQAPPGRWELQMSHNLITWRGTGRVTSIQGPSCITFDAAPEDGFARLLRVAEPVA